MLLLTSAPRFDLYLPGAAKLSDFLKEQDYKNPTGSATPFQYASGDPSPLFVWYSKYPEKLSRFQNHVCIR